MKETLWVASSISTVILVFRILFSFLLSVIVFCFPDVVYFLIFYTFFFLFFFWFIFNLPNYAWKLASVEQLTYHFVIVVNTGYLPIHTKMIAKWSFRGYHVTHVIILKHRNISTQGFWDECEKKKYPVTNPFNTPQESVENPDWFKAILLWFALSKKNIWIFV
jgi:hypothetical protein